MAGSRGYDSRAYVSNAPGAFYVVYSGDFGATVPGAPTLTYEAASGSFASETVYVEVTWVTAEGESPAGVSTAVGITSAEGAIKVVQPTVPTNGAAVIGWRIYENTSSGGSGGPVLVLAANSYTAQVTEGSTPNSYPVATTTVYLKSQSVSTVVPLTTDGSGIQPALPAITTDNSVDYYFIVPNGGSQWKQQKSVNYMRSDGVADPLGIQWGHMDFIQPVYPGVSTVVAANSWMVMNGYLFNATTGGTTASTFIGFSAFNTTKGATTTDGTVVWTSYGKAGLIRSVISNVYASTATPAAQAFEFFQE